MNLEIIVKILNMVLGILQYIVDRQKRQDDADLARVKELAYKAVPEDSTEKEYTELMSMIDRV